MKNKALFWFFIVIVVSTCIKLWVGSAIGLGDDEAYYWEWGQHPALSYLDHPPMVAWVGGLTTAVLGETEFGFRIGAVLSSAAFILLMYLLAFALFKKHSIAFVSVIIVSVAPVFAAGAFMMLPDAFLALGWILSVYLFYQATHSRQKRWWYLLGISFGFGLLSKYNMVVFPLSVLTFLVLSKEHRILLLRKEPWIALLIGLVLFLPVIIWNAEQGFPSLAFHLVERNTRTLTWDPFLMWLGGQLGYISPILWIGAIYSIVIAWKKSRLITIVSNGYSHGSKDSWLFIFAFSMPYVLFFSLVCSLSPTSKPHWPMMGYVLAFIGLAALIENSRRLHAGRWIYSWGVVGIVVGLLLTIALHVQSLYPVYVPKKPTHDTTNELYGWPQTAQAISSEYNALKDEGKPVVVIAPKYQLASQIAFYTAEHISCISLSNGTDQYDFWHRGKMDSSRIGCNALFLADNRYNYDPRAIMEFDSIITLPEIHTMRAGRKIRDFYLYRCMGFRGMIKPKDE
jgi:dolichol-phosphate mannosyltransferase